MASSSQSVIGQPAASPELMPAHHGLMPVAAILSVSAIISSQVCGTVQPFFANIFGEYQTNDLTLAPSGAAWSLPSTVPYFCQASPNHLSTLSATGWGASTTLPVCLTNVASNPGGGT